MSLFDWPITKKFWSFGVSPNQRFSLSVENCLNSSFLAHITYKWMTFEAKDISDKVRCYWECLGEPFKNLIRTQWEYFANRKNPQKSVPTPETQKKKKQYQVVQGWMVDECRWNGAFMEKERNWLLLFWSLLKALPLQQDSMFLVHTM